MPLILVVDDDVNILELLEFNLTKERYEVLTATDGQQALNLVRSKKPDLIILDIMLPEMDGFEVCRTLKADKETDNIPVIMLSARDDVLDKVVGLELGAEDYVTKPFSLREMLSRIKIYLRRKGQALNLSTEEPLNEIRVGKLGIKSEKYEALLDGVRLNLTKKEFELLHLLAKNPGKVFTRDMLLERVWSLDNIKEMRTVDVHIRYLREKIEFDPAEPEYIETVRGVGYRFKDQK